MRFRRALRFFCTLSLPLRGSFAMLEQKTASVTALMYQRLVLEFLLNLRAWTDVSLFFLFDWHSDSKWPILLHE